MFNHDAQYRDDAAQDAREQFLALFGAECARCGALHEPTEHELDGKPLCEACALAACAVFFGEALRAVEAELGAAEFGEVTYTEHSVVGICSAEHVARTLQEQGYDARAIDGDRFVVTDAPHLVARNAIALNVDTAGT